MNIRPYHVHDLDQTIQLWQNTGLVTPQNNSERDIERKLAVNPELFLVAELESEIVGSVMGGYEGHRGWINFLAVSPKCQRQGLATQLMREVELLLYAKGCPKINLQIRETNSAVIGFYRSLGYQLDAVVSMGRRFTE